MSELDESLELILDLLPDEHTDSQTRKHSLTKADGVVMISMIKIITAHQGCSIGLSVKQAEAIRNTPAKAFEDINDIVKERKHLLNALGVMTLAVLGFIGQQLFTKIEWHRIWANITK